MEIGYGKVCASKAGIVGAESAEDSNGKQQLDPAPTWSFKGDVTLWRNEQGEAQANTPWTVIQHSPTGFEWGYGGSAPADLALNILNAFAPPKSDGEEPVECFKGVCSATAMRLHQDFKWTFIAPMPRVGGTIKAETIRNWLATHAAITKAG
jgi:hypothetical protein